MPDQNGNDPQIAVLTGDLVKSTSLGPENIARAFAALDHCAHQLAKWMDAPLHFTRHRGDGWQVALTPSRFALRSALAFRAALKAEGKVFDCFVGLAEGQVFTDIGPDLNAETADVFVHSGRALELAKRQNTAFLHGNKGAADAAAILAGEISGAWTPAQASAMKFALHPFNHPNFTDISEALGKSRQTVTKALRAAKCDTLRQALTILEGDSRYE